MTQGDSNRSRVLLADLLDTEQFPRAIADFIEGYVNDYHRKLINFTKAGDIAKANYECGALETLKELLPRMVTFAKKGIRTI